MSIQYIVSGSNGFLGKKVVSCLLQQGEKVIGLCKKPDENNKSVRYVSNNIFLKNVEKYLNKKTVFIHLAFARANRGAEELVQSLDFTEEILNRVRNSDNLKKFIYISSQGVYGKTYQIRKVQDRVSPESLYTMAKFCAEKLVEMALDDGKYCILRLDNVIQSQNLVKSLAKSAIDNKHITIVGGKQVFSYIDGEDAALAIVKCACSETQKKKIYNLGPDRMRLSIQTIADILKQVAAKYDNEIDIEFYPDETELWAGMDSKDFCTEYKWEPKYNIFNMIERIYKEILEDAKGE